MARHIFLIRRRRVGGRRKSNVHVGPLPALFFVVLCLFAAVAGTMIDRAILAFESAPRTIGHSQ